MSRIKRSRSVNDQPKSNSARLGLGGREGVGKSTMCAHVAAQLTKGELPGDFYGTPKSVIIVSTEDDWSACTPSCAAPPSNLD